MFPSLSKVLTVAAAFSATAYASPQGWGGSSGGDQGGSSGGSGSYGNANSVSSAAAATSTAAYNYASASVSSSAVATASSLASGTACNNSPDLCSRTYDNVTHMGAHDSSFLRDSSTDNSIAGTQYLNATYALNNGLRLLQLQVHDLNGVIEMCHTTCDLLDAGTLQSWLTAIKDWMDNNANDVVTLLIVNSDGFNGSDFGAVFEASGIDEYGYTPDGTGSWPTLSTMISAGTRLVTFIASYTTDTSYSYLLNEWDYVFETAYEVTSLSGFNCTLDRPSTYDTYSAAISAGMMPLMNHFAYSILVSYEIPDVTDIDTTNSASTSTTGALGLHAETCNSEWSQKPTFVLVDFFNKGPAIDTADTMNGITATGRSNSSSSDASSSTSTSTSMGSSVHDAGSTLGALITAFVGAILLL
ncbi:putative PLC-like phosphodiesterase [Seiridium cardinale]